MTRSSVSTICSGSGVVIATTCFSADSDSFDFFEVSTTFDFVTRVGLLLNESVDC
jgi:hypothetical protein